MVLDMFCLPWSSCWRKACHLIAHVIKNYCVFSWTSVNCVARPVPPMGSQFPRFVSSFHCGYLALAPFLRHLPHSLDRDADSGLRSSLLSCHSPAELLVLLPFLLSGCCDSRGQEVCISATACRAKGTPSLPGVLPSFTPLVWPAPFFLECVRVEEISSAVLFEQGLGWMSAHPTIRLRIQSSQSSGLFSSNYFGRVCFRPPWCWLFIMGDLPHLLQAHLLGSRSSFICVLVNFTLHHLPEAVNS